MLEFTIAEACEILDPPLSEQQLREVIHALGWKPAGTRKLGVGHRGRPFSTYPADEILKLHKSLVPFLQVPGA